MNLINHNHPAVARALFLLLCAVPLSVLALEFHVATTGRDTNSGTETEPFASLERARNAVREALPHATEDIIVSIHAGTWHLDRSFALTPQDSGREGVAVIWRSVDGIGQAHLSGSTPLKGWQRHKGNIWKLKLKEDADFQTLYEDSRRLHKARFPNYLSDTSLSSAFGCYLISEAGSPHLERGNRISWLEYAVDDAPPAAASPAQMKVVLFPWGSCDWHRWTCQVTKIDRDARRIYFDNLGDRTEILGGARYFLEDEPAFLDAPGEFYLDRSAAVLYCIPINHGHPDKLNITAPVVLTLVQIQGGGRDNCVRNLRFDGLVFEETEAISPSLHWWSHDWGRRDYALIHLSDTEAITLSNCWLRNSGRHGVLMTEHNVGNTVSGSLIEQIGISGITLCNRFPAAKGFGASVARLEQNLLCNNRIHDVGQLGLYASCIELMNVSYNEICHSELFNSPRYAITMRGNTGAQHGPPVTTGVPPASRNWIHHLSIHHCGQDSGDMGALHAANLNNSGGGCTNTYEQITIADTRALDSMMDIPPNGIFLDWPKMAMDQIFRDIQIVRTQGDPFRSNGADNADSAVMQNVSWREGFNQERMNYAEIGVQTNYPPEFGGYPPPPF
ncbi:MAG: right-handed parallel beta-helix repeat-containing protein [Kiritimatiellae bacterium]|nr:right-handed parallel beta-helix repeat-containing protein [Kiritimatiellia bacterium]